jgi:hypothetical protein
MMGKVFIKMKPSQVSAILDEDVEIQECQSCNEKMEYWNVEKTKSNAGEESLDENAEIFVSWSPSDCTQAAFFWCEGCEILQVSHKECNTPLQLLGHQGFSRDGSQHYRDAKTGMKSVLTKPGPIDSKVPRFATNDLMQTKLRLSEWFACGADGTQSHFWFCPDCNTAFAFGTKQ